MYGTLAAREDSRTMNTVATDEERRGTALGDPPHLKLVAVLCAGGAFSIAQLTANTDISRQGVTKHLQVLADAGVVRDVKLGRERLWQLDPVQIEEAKRTLEVIGRQWEVALGKLKAFAESV